MGMNVDNQIPDGNGHLTTQNITEWLSGECTVNLRLECEQHCIRCAECREQIAMISQPTQPDENLEQSAEFQQLLRIGEHAAMRVWKQQRELNDAARLEPEKNKKNAKQESWFKRLGLVRRPALLWTGTAVLVLASAITSYLYWQKAQTSNQSDQLVERAMNSMRQAWYLDRPIKARVTGEFPYLPYKPTRGPGDSVPVNDTQLKAATVILNLEVAGANPTPSAKHALSRLHLLNKDFDEAEKLLQEVVSKEPQNASAYVDLGSAYFGQSEKEKSPILLFKASETLTKATEISPTLPEAWFNLALCHEEMFLFTKAKADWDEYLKLDIGSKWAEEARQRLQEVQERSILREPQLDKVAEELRAAVAEKNDAAISRLLQEHYTEATELMAGRFLDEYLAAAIEGKHPEAAQHHQLLKHLAELIRDTKGDHYFVDLLQFVESLPPAKLQKIRALRSQLQQVKKFLDAYQDKEAIQLAKAVKTEAESIADVCHTEAALYEIARIYSPETETKELPILRQQLLSDAIRRRHLQMQVRGLLALANQYGAERKMSSWLETGLKALDIAKRLNDADLTVAALRSVGFVYADLGEHEQSLNMYFAATQRLRADSLYLSKACLTYVNFARSLALYGHFGVARDYQHEALPYCRQYKPAFYLNAFVRAGKYTALAGQIDESLRLFQQAFSESEHYSQAINTQSLAVDLYLSQGDVLVKSQRFDEAESAYQKAREKLGTLKNLYYQSAIQHGLAAALLPQGKILEAEAALNKSVDLIEFSRSNVNAAAGRSTFVGSQLDVYKSMVEFQYFYRHSQERAFDFSEKYRSRELLDLLDQAQGTVWHETERDLKLRASAEPQSLSQIQQSLPANVQMLQYALTEKHLLIWVINPDGWLAEDVQITAAQIKGLVSTYLQSIRERREPTTCNPQAQELYRLLIQPVVKHLKPQQNLVIVPDGVLNSLPFAALINPDSQHYLVEEYILTINPSANVLSRLLAPPLVKTRKPVRSILAVSDPAFDLQLFPKLSRLPNTQQEVKAAAVLYQVSEELQQTRATKEAFILKAKQFQVLHLAAHSIVNANEPLLSAILLAAEPRKQNAPSESLLLAHEIFRMKLPHTRLVILSSCNSLVNQATGHNGLGGLAHAFFSAGVPTVIGSLWEVNDQSTASLMAAFHNSWRSGGASVGQALQQAQLTLLRSAKEDWRHPANWAAFYVSGDGITV